MNEILPGVWHWSAPHPNLGGIRVSSYWLESEGVAIDPLVPETGLEWFEQRSTPPAAIVLSNRHHYRDSARFHERFGVRVHVPEAGMHEFTEGQPVDAYVPGQTLPGGLRAIEIGALAPDDGGLYLASASALVLADAVVRSASHPDGKIGWVIDQLMDDPPQTKRGLLAALGRILDELEFEHLLLAHGLPLIGSGRSELEELVRCGGRTASDAFDLS